MLEPMPPTAFDLPAAVRSLRGHRRAAHLQAARVMQILSFDPAQRDGIAAAGSIPPLVRCLSSSSTALQQLAVTTLCQLSEDCLHRLAAMAAAPGIFPAVVALLRSTRDDITQEAAVVLAGNLASSSPDIRAGLGPAGAIPPLVQLLFSSNRTLQGAASHALCNLSVSSAEITDALVAAGGIEAMVHLLYSQDVSAQHSAAGTLQNLADGSPGNAASIVEAGAVPPLVQLLGSGSEQAQGSAAMALARLASGHLGSRAVIAAGGGIAALVPLLSSTTVLVGATDGSTMQIQAASALTLLAHSSPDRCAAIAAAGAIPPLVQLLRSENGEVQRRAAMILGSLAGNSPGTCAAIDAAGGREQLTRLSSSSNQEMRGTAAAALNCLLRVLDARSSSAVEGPAQPSATSTPAPAPAPALVICSAPGCTNTDGLRRCSGCGITPYCSRACQTAHWATHRAECKRMRAEAAAAASSGVGQAAEQAQL